MKIVAADCVTNAGKSFSRNRYCVIVSNNMIIMSSEDTSSGTNVQRNNLKDSLKLYDHMLYRVRNNLLHICAVMYKISSSVAFLKGMIYVKYAAYILV